MEVLHMPLAEAVEMVRRGEIHDAKTIIGLLLVERRVARRCSSGPRDVMLRGTHASARRRGVPVVDGDRAGPVGEHAGRVPSRPERLLGVAVARA